MVLKLLVFLLAFISLFSFFPSLTEASTYAPFGYISTPTSITKVSVGSVGYGSQCTINYNTPPPFGTQITYCGGQEFCRPVPGNGVICVEKPANGSVANGSFCYSDVECQSGYCFHPPGSIGTATCQTKCGPSNCTGGCIVTTTYLAYPSSNLNTPQGYPQDVNTCVLPTKTPTPSDPCLLTSTSKPLNCACQNDTNCASLYCSPSKFCQTRPTPTWTPTPSPIRATNTPIPTATLTPVPICDPDPLGASAGKLDEADFLIWKSDFLSGPSESIPKSGCLKPDNTIDLLDFQVWKNKSFRLI